MSDVEKAFTNPEAVARYTETALRKVPGFADLHRMTALLLAERASDTANILVVGAGGGLELKAMAQLQPNWKFTGVDPSSEMLDLARRTTSSCADRIKLVEGRVDQAALGPFDGTTCLLTLHFLDRNERLHTLREIKRRLKPGGAFVMVHHTSPDGLAERWLTRSALFADHAGNDPSRAASSAQMMAERLPLLRPQEEEDLLREAGFTEPALFYAAFSFRGWVAIADGG